MDEVKRQVVAAQSHQTNLPMRNLGVIVGAVVQRKVWGTCNKKKGLEFHLLNCWCKERHLPAFT